MIILLKGNSLEEEPGIGEEEKRREGKDTEGGIKGGERIRNVLGA
jgi:hypothetical protein